MTLKNDVKELKQELEDVKQESIAYQILTDYKKANKRLFILLMVILVMWFMSIGSFVYYVCNYGQETITDTINTNDTSKACIGDNCNTGDTYGNETSKNN